ncbi:MAG: hypothetical protein IJL69_02890 [Oscillospiraceae bacterium]|nr:hypothetical protein [Oscillospiraceae bacterium]
MTLGGTKTFAGWPDGCEPPVFTFELREGEKVIGTASVRGAGPYRFAPLRYDAPGTYAYTVRELAAGAAGVTFDERVYDFTVTVTDDGSGVLQAETAGAEIAALDFVNRYETGGLRIRKTVRGGPEDGGKAFCFTVTFDAPGAYPYSGSRSGTLSRGQNVWLGHGEFIEIAGLPAGTRYAVTEREDPDYSVESQGGTGAVAAGETAEASFVNVRLDVPQTGAPSKPGLWLGAMLLSGLGLGAACRAAADDRRKRRSHGRA